MRPFRFITTFEVAVDRSTAYDEAVHVERWAAEWPEVTEFTLLDEGDEQTVGRRGRARFRAPLDIYRLDVEVETIAAAPPRSFTIDAAGTLNGQGTWTFEEVGPQRTAIRFDWHARVLIGWLDRIEPVVHRVLVRAHNRTMRRGVEAYARHLGAPLEQFESREAEPLEDELRKVVSDRGTEPPRSP